MRLISKRGTPLLAISEIQYPPPKLTALLLNFLHKLPALRRHTTQPNTGPAPFHLPLPHPAHRMSETPRVEFQIEKLCHLY